MADHHSEHTLERGKTGKVDPVDSRMWTRECIRGREIMGMGDVKIPYRKQAYTVRHSPESNSIMGAFGNAVTKLW